MADVPFLKQILAHTVKVADKSQGNERQFMLEQADRLRKEISLHEPIPTKKKKIKRTKR